MKSNTFNYSLLAVSVAVLMGIAGTANAAGPTTATADKIVTINNFASATYTVANTSGAPQTSISNTVTVNVTEQGAFTLLAISPEPVNDNNADTNKDLTINPQANQTVTFVHTLENNGNVTDTYTVTLDQLTNDNFNYSGLTISYVTNLNATSQSINSGGTITLAKDEKATITIVATSNAQRIVGDNGTLTVTASSAYLKARNGAGAATNTYQAVNTDNAITRTPIFAITKSANSNLNNNVFDAANKGAYVDYTIVIKNEGNAAANAFTIVDRLPLGLVIDSNVAPKIGDVALTASQFTTSSDGRTLTIPNRNLAIDAELTVTLRAIKDTAQTIKTDAVLLNVAEVQDDTLNDTGITNADLIDRSDDTGTENNYEGTSNLGIDNDDDASVTTRNQTRNITVTGDATKEIPLISTNNVYTYTITNSGTDITEANAAGEVFFTVTPTTDISPIDIVRVFVDKNGNGTFDAGETELTADTNGNYDLFDVVGAAGLTAGQTAKVSVELSSNGVFDNTSGVNNIDSKEVMTITVTAQTTVDGTVAPTAGSAASTTTLKGINLIKGQAVASCTSPGTLTYDTSTTALTGQPGQCIYYQITAENTFTEANKIINKVAITDIFETSKVSYNANLTANIGGNTVSTNPSYSSPTLTATFDSLAPGQTGTIRFSNTILVTGATTTP